MRQNKGSKEEIRALDPEEAYEKALKTALGILQRRDNTEKALRDKLFLRGYGSETVDSVLDYLKSKRLLDERRMLLNAVGYLANDKLYGKSRILMELRAKGFSSETVSSLDFSDPELEEIDFRANCIKLFVKRGGISDSRTLNTLVRYGHSGEDIRFAVRYAESLIGGE